MKSIHIALVLSTCLANMPSRAVGLDNALRIVRAALNMPSQAVGLKTPFFVVNTARAAQTALLATGSVINAARAARTALLATGWYFKKKKLKSATWPVTPHHYFNNDQMYNISNWNIKTSGWPRSGKNLAIWSWDRKPQTKFFGLLEGSTQHKELKALFKISYDTKKHDLVLTNLTLEKPQRISNRLVEPEAQARLLATLDKNVFKHTDGNWYLITDTTKGKNKRIQDQGASWQLHTAQLKKISDCPESSATNYFLDYYTMTHNHRNPHRKITKIRFYNGSGNQILNAQSFAPEPPSIKIAQPKYNAGS